MRNIFIAFLSLLLSFALLAGDYSHIDPEGLVPKDKLLKALDYYQANWNSIPNKRFIGLIDFRQHNSKKRFYVIDMDSGYVEAYLSAHGKNSDPDFDGFATHFSNVPDSLKSSLGFYLTAESYFGSNGYSLRLDGLSSTNSNARIRGIVIHPAPYVMEGQKIGRSFGCPAVEERVHKELIDQIKDGVLLYATF